MSADRFPVGSPILVKPDAVSAFAGREGWVRCDDEQGLGYYVRIGVADWLWFGAEELSARVAGGETA